MKKIFATQERQDILRNNGISFAVDTELNFVFKTEEVRKKAIKILKGALAL